MCVGWVECLGFLEEMVVATTRMISVDPEFILKVESTGYSERLDERGGRKRGARDASKVFGLSSRKDEAVFSWYREKCVRQRGWGEDENFSNGKDEFEMLIGHLRGTWIQSSLPVRNGNLWSKTTLPFSHPRQTSQSKCPSFLLA